MVERAPSTGNSCVIVWPLAVILSSATSFVCVQSASAAHNGVGAVLDGWSRISYKRLFWLLEPALSTSIFIANQSIPNLVPRAYLQSWFVYSWSVWRVDCCTLVLMGGRDALRAPHA